MASSSTDPVLDAPGSDNHDAPTDVQGLPPPWGNFLHAFALPSELLDVLQLRLLGPAPVSPPTTILPSEGAKDSTAAPGGLTCQVCGATFGELEAQREHFRSDWHRFNVSRHLRSSSRPHQRSSSPAVGERDLGTQNGARRGYRPVGEDDFAKMVEELKVQEGSSTDSSESDASESSDHDGAEGAEGDGTIDRLLRLHRRRYSRSRGFASSSSDEDEDEAGTGARQPKSPVVWMTASPLAPKNVHLGLYRCVLPIAGISRRASGGGTQTDAGVIEELKDSQVGSETVKHGSQGKHALDGPKAPEEAPPHWTVMMMGGGHFAAAVVSLRPKLRHVSKHKAPEMELVVLAHKTFHRYTSACPPSYYENTLRLTQSDDSEEEAGWRTERA